MSSAGTVASTRRKSTVRNLIKNAEPGGDLDCLDTIIAPKFIRHDVDFGDIYGLDNYKAVLTAFNQAVPDGGSEILMEIEEGDLVAVRWVYQGTHTGALPFPDPEKPTPASGESVTMTGTTTFRFIPGGRVAEMWVDWNSSLQVMTALGLV